MTPEQIAAFEAAFPELKGKLTADSKPGDIPGMLEAAKAEKDAADKAALDAKAATDKTAADAKAKADADAAALGKADPAVAAAVAEAKQVADSAKKTADGLASAQAIKDARERAAPMLPPDFSFAGKTADQIKMAAIKRVAPKLQSLTDSSSSDAIEAVFATFEESKTRYVADAKGAALGDSAEPRATYKKNMKSLFVSSQKDA